MTTGKAHTSSKTKASLPHLYLLLMTASNSKEGFNLTKALGSAIASILLYPPFFLLPKESPQHSNEKNRLKCSDCLNRLFAFFSERNFSKDPEVGTQGGTGCIPPAGRKCNQQSPWRMGASCCPSPSCASTTTLISARELNVKKSELIRFHSRSNKRVVWVW